MGIINCLTFIFYKLFSTQHLAFNTDLEPGWAGNPSILNVEFPILRMECFFYSTLNIQHLTLISARRRQHWFLIYIYIFIPQ